MPFYDILHTGHWRVSLNEQYVWYWLRTNNIERSTYNTRDVSIITANVEDILNMSDFKLAINVPKIVLAEYRKHYHVRTTKTQCENVH